MGWGGGTGAQSGNFGQEKYLLSLLGIDPLAAYSLYEIFWLLQILQHLYNETDLSDRPKLSLASYCLQLTS
jgi:hypothetical protein